MDGFTLIPKQQKTDPVLSANNLDDISNSNNIYSAPKNTIQENSLNLTIDNMPQVEGILEEQNTEIKTTETPKAVKTLYFFSLLAFISSLVYLGYILFMWQLNIANVEEYSSKIKSVESKINKNEIVELQNLDKVLKSLKEKLDNHILSTQVFAFINKNIRNTLVVTEYNISEEKSGDIAVVFSCVSPSFREMAEQTEKMIQLQKEKQINSFTISNLSLENDSNKVKFNIKVFFDKQKVSAGTNINKK